MCIRDSVFTLPDRENSFVRDRLNGSLRVEEEAVNAVSYTHLDVYKRQAEDDSFLYERSKELVKEVSPRSRRDTGLRIKFSDYLPLMRRACLIALKKVGIEKDYTSAHLEAVCAVSYTHLRGSVKLFCRPGKGVFL